MADFDGPESLESSMNVQPTAGVGGWIPFPTQVCAFFRKGTCLRISCHYYHGTDQSLAELRAKGATLYRINDGSVWYGPPGQPAKQGDVSEPGSLQVSSTSMSNAGLDSTMTENTSTKTADGRSVVACLSYLSGTCSRSDCRFVHLKPDIRLLPGNVCAYHGGPNGCSKGQKCRYFHGPQQLLSDMKERGIVMYNPINNEPYETIPEVLEDPACRRPQPSSTSQRSQQQRSPPHVISPLHSFSSLHQATVLPHVGSPMPFHASPVQASHGTPVAFQPQPGGEIFIIQPQQQPAQPLYSTGGAQFIQVVATQPTQPPPQSAYPPQPQFVHFVVPSPAAPQGQHVPVQYIFTSPPPPNQ